MKPTVRSNKLQSEQTASPDKYPQGYFNDKECKECNNLYSPKSPSHLYCSDICADIGHQRNWLRKNYKITLEEYEEIFRLQDGKCAICWSIGFKITKNQRQLIVIDHCHSTGKIRGLLCHNCNRALGLFKDNVKNLSNAILYLEGATTIESIGQQAEEASRVGASASKCMGS